MKNKISKNRLFLFAFSFISLLSVFLRFYNYSNRWSLWVDQASFALLTRYAFFYHKLPLLGQFTSAGPFQAGGEWYWLLMTFQAFYPNSLITPWVGITVLYVVFVMVIMLVAKELLGRKFAIITGLLAAVSTSQISQSVNLTNQSPLPLIALLALWFALKYLKRKQGIYLLLLSILSGLAPTFHTQGFILIPLVFITLILSGRPTLKKITIILLGLLLPWVPIFIADSHNHFSNTRNMITYYLHDQYKISLDVLGRRWATYAGVFWPKAWALIIGGNVAIGYIIPALLIVFGAINVYKKRISKEWYLIIFSFILMLIMIRYARTPIYDSYLLIAHPFIFLLTGWAILNFLKSSRIFGILLLLIIITLSLNKDIKDIVSATNGTAVRAEKNRSVLVERYPNTKFTIYDYKFQTPGISQPLALYLDEKNKVDDGGKKIGVSSVLIANLFLPVIYNEEGAYYIVDVSSLSEKELLVSGWESVNPSAVYRNVQEWYKYKK